MKREKFKSLLLACWILLKSTFRSFYSYLWCSPIEQLLWHRVDLLLHLHSSLPDPHPLSHLNLEHLKLGASKIQCQKLSLLCKSGWKRRKIFNLLLLLLLLFFFKDLPSSPNKRDINTSNLSHQEWSGHVSAAFLQLRRPNFQLRAPSSFQPGNELRYQLTGHHGGALHAETCRPERDTEHREQNKVRCTAGFSLEQEGMKERKIYISRSLICILWTFLSGVTSFSYLIQLLFFLYPLLLLHASSQFYDITYQNSPESIWKSDQQRTSLKKQLFSYISDMKDFSCICDVFSHMFWISGLIIWIWNSVML